MQVAWKHWIKNDWKGNVRELENVLEKRQFHLQQMSFGKKQFRFLVEQNDLDTNFDYKNRPGDMKEIENTLY